NCGLTRAHEVTTPRQVADPARNRPAGGASSSSPGGVRGVGETHPARIRSPRPPVEGLALQGNHGSPGHQPGNAPFLHPQLVREIARPFAHGGGDEAGEALACGSGSTQMSSIASPTTEPGAVSRDASGVGSTPMQRVMSIDALRGMDMFFIVGMEEVFEALSRMFPMSPSLNDRLQHAPWAGFHFYDLIFPLFAFIIGTSLVFSLSKAVATEGGKNATTRK